MKKMKSFIRSLPRFAYVAVDVLVLVHLGIYCAQIDAGETDFTKVVTTLHVTDHI